MAHKSWKSVAKKVLGKKAIQHEGDGSDERFALVTSCRDQVDFSLWATRESANKQKHRLNQGGCCGVCEWWRHEVIDLSDESLNKG